MKCSLMKSSFISFLRCFLCALCCLSLCLGFGLSPVSAFGTSDPGNMIWSRAQYTYTDSNGTSYTKTSYNSSERILSSIFPTGSVLNGIYLVPSRTIPSNSLVSFSIELCAVNEQYNFQPYSGAVIVSRDTGRPDHGCYNEQFVLLTSVAFSSSPMLYFSGVNATFFH